MTETIEISAVQDEIQIWIDLYDSLRCQSINWDYLEGKKIDAVLNRQDNKVTLVLEDG